MHSFNPFDKPLEDLISDDLVALLSTSEGWFVEYKQEVPSAWSIAKSISSFANQHGGWLFYGVKGTRDGENLASSFPGVSIQDWPALQERITSAVVAHIGPPPHFRARLIKGPAANIDLSTEKGIVAIWIPRGLEAPFVHSSGMIYRRTADQSDPKPATDRSTLDILWARKEKAEKEFRGFIERKPIVAKAESEFPRLTAYLFQDPVGDLDLRSSIGLDQFREILESGAHPPVDIPFQSIFSDSMGYIGRQTKHVNPDLLGLTFRHSFDGTTTVHVPLMAERATSERSDDYLGRYELGATFLERMRKGGFAHRKWLDLNSLLMALIGLYSKHERVCKAGGIKGSTYLKLRFSSVWRCVPFFDTAGYVDSIQDSLPPLLQEDEIWVPASQSLDSLHEVTLIGSKADDDDVPNVIGIFNECLYAFGLESVVRSASSEEIVAAAIRAAGHSAEER